MPVLPVGDGVIVAFNDCCHLLLAKPQIHPTLPEGVTKPRGVSAFNTKLQKGTAKRACGYFGDPKRECRYSPKQVEKTTATGSPARCWIALIFTSSLGPFGERVAEHARRLALQDLPAPLRLTSRPVALDLRTDAQIGFIPSAIPVLLDEIGIGERFPSPPG